MEQLALDLWHRALSRIQTELPSQAYETWFQPTRAVSATSDSLTVEVPNLFFRNWLASHYTELIDKTLRALAPSHVKVVYTVGAQEMGRTDVLSRVAPTREIPLGPSSARNTTSASSDFLMNPCYTFSQFVIGPSNRFAHAAALAISESPARVYNPLFIYGGVGLGKTHLMQAIGHRIRELQPQAKCLYLSSERFTNQLISAIQNRSMASIRDRFRSADILLVDDIHFIGGKESTQESFFHTFNTLYDAHRQIVISSDRSPKELHGVEERLVSRFEWGLVADVQPPDLETRVAILRKKAQTQGCPVPDPVTLFIAERISSNIRELEGALNRVIASSVLTNREISVSMAQDVLRGLVAESARHVTVEKIQHLVANYFSLSLSDLKGKRRTKEISLPRQVSMALARELTDASLPAIGEAFGGRDHATVIYSCQRISSAEKEGGRVRELMNLLRGQFKHDVE